MGVENLPRGGMTLLRPESSPRDILVRLGERRVISSSLRVVTIIRPHIIGHDLRLRASVPPANGAGLLVLGIQIRALSEISGRPRGGILHLSLKKRYKLKKKKLERTYKKIRAVHTK